MSLKIIDLGTSAVDISNRRCHREKGSPNTSPVFSNITAKCGGGTKWDGDGGGHDIFVIATQDTRHLSWFAEFSLDFSFNN